MRLRLTRVEAGIMLSMAGWLAALSDLSAWVVRAGWVVMVLGFSLVVSGCVAAFRIALKELRQKR
jgi:hypothetical protein